MENEEVGRTVGRIGPSQDKDRTNAEKVIFAAITSGKSIASAESVTAGGFGYALTRVPGSSRVYLGGLVTYTRETKQRFLKIPDEICDHGLVTPEITLEMARRVRELFGSYYSVAVTGNAGPTADTGGASVGRVYWAVVDQTGAETVQQFDFFGNRDEVRAKAVTAGLRMLRNFIEGGTE